MNTTRLLIALAVSATGLLALTACSSSDDNGGSTSSSSSSSSSGTSGSGTRHTCAELSTCCGKIKDADTKTQCETNLAQSMSNDNQCNTYFPAYAPECP